MTGVEMHAPTSGEVSWAVGTMFAVLTGALAMWRKQSKTKLDVHEDSSKGDWLDRASEREQSAYRREQEALQREQDALRREQASQGRIAGLEAQIAGLMDQVERMRAENARFKRALLIERPEWGAFLESGPGSLNTAPEVKP